MNIKVEFNGMPAKLINHLVSADLATLQFTLCFINMLNIIQPALFNLPKYPVCLPIAASN